MEPNTCENDACECELDDDGAVERDGRRYCSDGCADARGCDHVDCDCSDSSAE